MNLQTATTIGQDRLSEMNLMGWLGQAAAGAVLEYHKGFLALDRSFLGGTLNPDDRVALVRLASRAMKLSDQGFVHLVQRRIGPDRFSYRAIARPRPKAIPASLSSLLLAEVA